MENMKERNLKSFETIYFPCFLVCTLHTRCPTSNNLPNKSEGSERSLLESPVKASIFWHVSQMRLFSMRFVHESSIPRVIYGLQPFSRLHDVITLMRP